MYIVCFILYILYTVYCILYIVYCILHVVNVKMTESIRPNFFVVPHMTPGKVYDLKKNIDFQNP